MIRIVNDLPDGETQECEIAIGEERAAGTYVRDEEGNILITLDTEQLEDVAEQDMTLTLGEKGNPQYNGQFSDKGIFS